MKDIAHNIDSLQEVSSPWLYKQYVLFRSMIADLYINISDVIDDKYSDEVLVKMIDLVKKINKLIHYFYNH